MKTKTTCYVHYKELSDTTFDVLLAFHDSLDRLGGNRIELEDWWKFEDTNSSELMPKLAEVEVPGILMAPIQQTESLRHSATWPMKWTPLLPYDSRDLPGDLGQIKAVCENYLEGLSKWVGKSKERLALLRAAAVKKLHVIQYLQQCLSEELEDKDEADEAALKGINPQAELERLKREFPPLA
jgi:hypothetical protein